MSAMTTAAPDATVAERLFARKLGMAASLDCRPLFDELADLDSRLAALGERRAEAEERLRGAKAECEDAETLAALGVEGRNESERKARRVEAMRADPRWQAATALLSEAANTITRLDVEAEAVKRQARRCERTIEYRCSVLRFLAN